MINMCSIDKRSPKRHFGDTIGYIEWYEFLYHKIIKKKKRKRKKKVK